MKIANISLIVITLLLPTLSVAGEPSKGTVIMISSVSGWLLLSSAVLFWKEVRRGKHHDDR